MKINRELLLKEVEAVMPGLSKKELIEQSSCVVFKDKKVHTYNDEVACSYATDIPLEGAIQAEPLAELLRRRKDEELEIEVGEGALNIKGKRFKSSIRMENEVLLPINAIKEPKKWKKLPTNFTDGLKYVISCAGRDESQFALTCVHVAPDFIEACDNQQISRYKTKTGSWVRFRNPSGLILSCRRYSEDYPNMDAILKVDGTKTALPKGIKDAVSCAEIFSSQNVDDDTVSVDLTKNKLKISGEGASGSYEETKKIKYAGDNISFRIPPTLLVELVNKSNECEVTKDRLKIEFDKLIYVTALKVPTN
jgi:hypothetical protein